MSCIFMFTSKSGSNTILVQFGFNLLQSYRVGVCIEGEVVTSSLQSWPVRSRKGQEISSYITL